MIQMTAGDKIKLRAELAGKAMQGLISNERWFMNVVNANMGLDSAGKAEKIVAEAARDAADALMAELGLSLEE